MAPPIAHDQSKLSPYPEFTELPTPDPNGNILVRGFAPIVQAALQWLGQISNTGVADLMIGLQKLVSRRVVDNRCHSVVDVRLSRLLGSSLEPDLVETLLHSMLHTTLIDYQGPYAK